MCIIVSIFIGNGKLKFWLIEYFVVMSKANVFPIILIYDLKSSTLTIDKDVLYHLYILSFCMKQKL